LYVTPGLIDIHVHAFEGTNLDQAYMDGPEGVRPDEHSLNAGVTTVVDAGSSGWRTFEIFKKNIIDKSQTRVLAFLNIVGDGMGAHQQNTKDMDPIMAAKVAILFKNYIVGFKVAHFRGLQWIPVDSAVKAGGIARIPVMVDYNNSAGLNNPPNSIEALFTQHLRPGDILTHCFHSGRGEGTSSKEYKEPIVDENGNVKPFVFAAQKRGIIFDVGHGGNGFVFSQAVPAIKQGFLPNSISSDIHLENIIAGMKDMSNILSKFLNMGLSLQEVITRATWNPAKEIKREELGNLSIGTEADIAVFNLRKGDFGFVDAHNRKIKGTLKLENELTIRSGKIVWDLNGISVPEWNVDPKIY